MSLRMDSSRTRNPSYVTQGTGCWYADGYQAARMLVAATALEKIKSSSLLTLRRTNAIITMEVEVGDTFVLHCGADCCCRRAMLRSYKKTSKVCQKLALYRYLHHWDTQGHIVVTVATWGFYACRCLGAVQSIRTTWSCPELGS